MQKAGTYPELECFIRLSDVSLNGAPVGHLHEFAVVTEILSRIVSTHFHELIHRSFMKLLGIMGLELLNHRSCTECAEQCHKDKQSYHDRGMMEQLFVAFAVFRNRRTVSLKSVEGFWDLWVTGGLLFAPLSSAAKDCREESSSVPDHV